MKPHVIRLPIKVRTRRGLTMTVDLGGPADVMLDPLVVMAARGGPYTWLFWLVVVATGLVVLALTDAWWFTSLFLFAATWLFGDSPEHANRERVVERWASSMLIEGLGGMPLTPERREAAPAPAKHLTIPGGLEY